MQDTQGEVMWPTLVANKLLRRCLGSSRFVADSPNVEVSSGRCVSSTRRFSLERMAGRNQTDTRNYKLFVSTWNVGGVAPPDNMNLEDWMDTCNNPCDIYVLGFQEVVPLSASNVLGTGKTRISMKWNSLIGAALNKSRTSTRHTSKRKLQEKKFAESKTTERQKVYPYKDGDTDAVIPQDFKCIISKQMVGIFITVWVRGNLRRFIRNPNVACVGCGIMGCLGNKGSVSVSFCLHETSFCFVCSHLASGGKEGDEIHRNSDAVEILSRTCFPPSFDLPRKILEHDRVVWLGDLNYRISMPEDTTRLLVDEGCWDALLKKDQLRDELSEGGVFEDWREGAICYAPTYKYNPNSDKYYGGDTSEKGEKRRAPAWCDRILWYGKGMMQKQYGRGESRLSDHRPVRAVFSVEVEEVWSVKALGRFFLSDRFDMTQKEIEMNTNHEHKK